MKSFRAALIATASAVAVLSAQAADPVTEAMTAAYAPYRVVLFRTNTRAQAEAEQAMAAAQTAWRGFVDQHGRQPSLPYSRDPAYATSLADVGRVYEKAQTQIRAGSLTEAHETLEGVRDLLADLRRRNGVVTYSDHMNTYHLAMEHLLADGPRLLGGPQASLALMERVGVLGHLAQRLRSEAPAAATAMPEFNALLGELDASVGELRQAVMAQDGARITAALGRLKAPYSKLFLRFG